MLMRRFARREAACSQGESKGLALFAILQDKKLALVDGSWKQIPWQAISTRKGRGLLCWTLGDMACQGARKERKGLARELLSDIRSGQPTLDLRSAGGR